MTAINFPDNPQVDDLFTVGDRTWRWTGVSWDAEVTKQIVGPTGATGAQGPQGNQGIPGVGVPTGGTSTQILAKSSDEDYTTEWVDKPKVSYSHTQNAVSYIWVVTHNLGYYPNVVVEDSAGTVIEGEITYDSVNQLTITLSVALTGYAYLS